MMEEQGRPTSMIASQARSASTSLMDIESRIDSKIMHLSDDPDRSSRFKETVLAVYDIIDQKLYRDKQQNIESYFKKYWNISRAQAYRLYNCGAIVKELEEFPVQPSRERYCRILKKITKTADDRRRLWAAVLEQIKDNEASLSSNLITTVWERLSGDKWDAMTMKPKVTGPVQPRYHSFSAANPMQQSTTHNFQQVAHHTRQLPSFERSHTNQQSNFAQHSNIRTNFPSGGPIRGPLSASLVPNLHVASRQSFNSHPYANSSATHRFLHSMHSSNVLSSPVSSYVNLPQPTRPLLTEDLEGSRNLLHLHQAAETVSASPQSMQDNDRSAPNSSTYVSSPSTPSSLSTVQDQFTTDTSTSNQVGFNNKLPALTEYLPNSQQPPVQVTQENSSSKLAFLLN